jgi:hypothetical protein
VEYIQEQQPLTIAEKNRYKEYLAKYYNDILGKFDTLSDGFSKAVIKRLRW